MLAKAKTKTNEVTKILQNVKYQILISVPYGSLIRYRADESTLTPGQRDQGQCPYNYSICSPTLLGRIKQPHLTSLPFV